MYEILTRVLHTMTPLVYYYINGCMGLFGKYEPSTWEDCKRFLWGNVLYVGIPFLIWLIISIVLKLNKAISQSGFVGCHLSILIMLYIVYYQDPTDHGSAWFAYYPLSLILLVSCCFVGWAIKKLL